MNRRNNKTPPIKGRSFGTKLSANSPLPPRHTPKTKSATPSTVTTASQFVDESVNTAVDRVGTNANEWHQQFKQKSPKSETVDEAQSVERTTDRGQFNNSLKSGSNVGDGGVDKTPAAKLLAFSETPADSFKIFTGTPSSAESSPGQSFGLSPGENKHWTKRAVTSGAHPSEGSFLYSTLEATSPSFAKSSSDEKSWAQAVAQSTAPEPKNLLKVYATQQLRRPGCSNDGSESVSSPGYDVTSPQFKSPDSTASVAPTPFKQTRPYHSYLHTQVASPTGSIISTSTTNTTASTLFHNHIQSNSLRDAASRMGPLEYAIQFPPGPLPLKLERVIENDDGKSVGCCVANVLEEFDLEACESISANGSKVTLQPNDLLISLNSISVLSRPHSTILSLLQQFESHPKTIVFRSLDNVWKSQFQSRTMRNVRSGKRVSTAMDVESMERELYSWIETPTKVENDRVAEAVRKRMQRKLEKHTKRVEDGVVLTTPMKKPSSDIFSPSNVKKISQSTPTPLKSVDPNKASTTKKKNLGKKLSETPSKKKLQQIGKVLIGNDANNQGFEKVLRLKKEVLNELHSVRLALIQQSRTLDGSIDGDLEKTGVTVDGDLSQEMTKESLLHQAKALHLRLGSDDQFVERFVDMQVMMRQETAKSSALQKKVEHLSEQTETVAGMQQKLYHAYDAMKNTTKDHDDQLLKKEKEIDELRTELQIASERTFEKEKLSVIMQTDLEEEKSKAQVIQSILEDTQRSKSQQENIITTLEKEVDRKQRLIEEAEAASDLKSEELLRLRNKLGDLESKIKDNLNASRSMQESAMKEDILLKMVEQQRLDFEKREESMEEQVQLMQSKLQILQVEISKVKMERDESLEKLKAANASKFDAHQAELLKRASDLETERAALVRDKDACNARISDLYEQVECHDALVKQLQEKIQSQTASMAERDALINDLREEIHGLAESNQEQVVVRSVLAENLSKYIAASGDGLVKLDELSNIVETKLEHFSIRIAKSVADCRAALHVAAANEADLHTQIDTLTKLSSEKEFSLQRAASETAELENKVVEVAAELKNSLIREQNERTHLSNTAEALDGALSKLDAKNDELKQLDDQIQRLKLEVSKGDALRKDHELRLQQSHDEISNLHKEKSQLQIQIQTEQDQHSRSECQLRGEIEELKSHVDRELTRNKELLSQIDSLTSDLENNKSLLAANRDEFDVTLKQRDSLNQSLSQKITELDESYKSMQAEYTSSDMKCSDMSNKLASALTSLQEKEERLSQVVSEVKEMRADATTLTFQLQTVKEEKSVLEESFRTRQHQLMSESSSQRERLLEKDNRIIDLQNEILRLASEKNSLKTELNDIDNKVQAMASEHKCAVQVLEDEKCQLRDEIEASRCEAAASIAQLKSNLETAEQLLDQGDEEIRILSTEREQLESKVTDLGVLLENSQAELTHAIATRDEYVTRIEKESKSSRDRIEALTNQFHSQQEEARKLKFERDELAHTIASTKLSLADANSLHSDLRSRFDNIKSALDSKQAEAIQLKSQNDSLSATVEDLSIQLNQSMRDIKTLEKVKSEHLGEISLLETTKDMLSKQLCHIESQSSKEIDLLKVDKYELMRNLESKTSQISALTNQKEDLVATVQQMQSALRSADSRATSLSTEKERLTVKVEDLSSQIETLRLESQDQTAQFDSQLVQFEEQVKQPLHLKQEEALALKATIDKLTKEIEDLKHEYGSNEDMLRCQLLYSLEQREQDAAESTSLQLELDSRIEEHADTILARDKELLSMRARKVKLEQVINDLKSKIKELEVQSLVAKDSAEARERSLLESVMKKEDEISTLTSRQHALEEALEQVTIKYKEEQENLTQALSAKNLYVSNHTAENADLNRTINDLRSSAESLSKAIKSKDTEIEDLSEQQAELSNAVNELKLKLEKEADRFECSIGQKEAIISELSASKSDLEKTVDREHEKIKATEEKVQQEKQSFQTRLSSMQSAEQGLQAELKDLRQQAIYNQAKAQSEKETFECTHHKMLGDITNLQNSIAAEKIKYQHLMGNLESTREALSLKESELLKCAEKKEAAVAEANRKHAELEVIIDELKREISVEKATTDDLSSRLDTLSSSLSLKEEEIELLKATGKSTQDSLEQSSLEIQTKLNAKIESLTNELAASKRSGHDLMAELNTTLEQLNDANKDKQCLEQANARISSELQSCQDEQKNEKASLQSLKTQLNQKDTQMDAKEKELRVKLQEAIDWSDSLKVNVNKQEVLLCEKDNKISALSDEIESIKLSCKTTISGLEREMTGVKSEMLSCKDTHEQDLKEMNELRSKLQEALNWSDSLRSDLEDKMTLLKEKEDIIESLSFKIEIMQTSHHETVTELEAEIQSSVESNQHELAAAKCDLKSCQEELVKLKSSHQKDLLRMRRLEMSSTEATNRITDLETSLSERDNQIMSLDRALATKAHYQTELESHQAILTATINDKENAISSLSSHNQSLEASVEELRAELGQYKEKTEQERKTVEFKLQSTMEDLESSMKQLAKEKNSHQEAIRELEGLYLELHEAREGSSTLLSDLEEKGSTISSLRAMLHRTHLDVCQLSMELSCTKGATVLCMTDVKKSVERVVNDLVHYFEAKEINYKSIINELNVVVSEHQKRLTHEDEALSMKIDAEQDKVAELSLQLEQKNTKLRKQCQTIERLESDIVIARDELICAHAEVACGKEMEASYHAERILLHQAISSILNSPSSDFDESIASSMHPYERFLNFVENELRDLCILHNIDIFDRGSIPSKPETINTILQTMKMSATNNTQLIDLNQTSDSQQLRDFISDIDLAERKVLNMNDKLICASQSREELERLLTMEQERTIMLEHALSETNSQLESKMKLLSQTQDQHSKLQTKLNHAMSEIDACQSLAVELKQIVIEKNAEIQNKESKLFQLQYELDDLTARSEGMLASFDGGRDLQAEMPASHDVNRSVERHDELVEKVTHLEQTIIRMNQDSTNLSSMHQALVDGLESECQKLTGELDQARERIWSLEDIQSRLEEDCEAKERINSDFESAIKILKEQKGLITSEVTQLTAAVTSYAPSIEGFLTESPTTCIRNLQYVGRFLDFLYTLYQSSSMGGDASTPKTRGRGGFTESSNLIVELKDMRNTLKNVLASPTLTPVRHGDGDSTQDDLYYDLVNAVGQLERLSENFRDCQEQWKDKEHQLTLLIQNLETKSRNQISDLESEKAWRKRLTDTVVSNLQRRRHCSVLRRAFQAWACQARLAKHLNIVKDMAKELLQTRQKVLLLKSHFIQP